MTRSLHMEQHEFPDVDLILNGDPAEYLKNVAGSHGLEGERPLKMNAALRFGFGMWRLLHWWKRSHCSESCRFLYPGS